MCCLLKDPAGCYGKGVDIQIERRPFSYLIIAPGAGDQCLTGAHRAVLNLHTSNMIKDISNIITFIHYSWLCSSQKNLNETRIYAAEINDYYQVVSMVCGQPRGQASLLPFV